jgi:hypothetical protein
MDQEKLRKRAKKIGSQWVYAASSPYDPEGYEPVVQGGLCYREWLVGQALAGLATVMVDIPSEWANLPAERRIADWAVRLADEVLLSMAVAEESSAGPPPAPTPAGDQGFLADVGQALGKPRKPAEGDAP